MVTGRQVTLGQTVAGLSALESLDLHNTKVTAAGVAELQKALPGCKITWDGNEKK